MELKGKHSFRYERPVTLSFIERLQVDSIRSMLSVIERPQVEQSGEIERQRLFLVKSKYEPPSFHSPDSSSYLLGMTKEENQLK